MAFPEGKFHLVESNAFTLFPFPFALQRRRTKCSFLQMRAGLEWSIWFSIISDADQMSNISLTFLQKDNVQITKEGALCSFNYSYQHCINKLGSKDEILFVQWNNKIQLSFTPPNGSTSLYTLKPHFKSFVSIQHMACSIVSALLILFNKCYKLKARQVGIKKYIGTS